MNATAALCLGTQTPSFGKMDCDMYDLVMHDRPLSAEEIRLDAISAFIP